MTAEALSPPSFTWRRFLAVAGPGIVVMLADTDAGSSSRRRRAARNGAIASFAAVRADLVLYIVQELTVRLGAVTGKGHAELISDISAAAGRGSRSRPCLRLPWRAPDRIRRRRGVGNLLGVPPPVTLALVVAAMLAMALMHGYGTVERIAIAVGAFELVFLLVALLADPASASRVRRDRDPAERPQVPPARLRQHRRGHHAVDGVSSSRRSSRRG